ncbi:hypothetical protein BAE44_0020989, partial [Dichanthelium oligosanthes]
LERSGKYTTKSLYEFMTHSGVVDALMVEIWKCKVPLKIQIFMWIVFHDKIQPAVPWKRRNWSGAEQFKPCAQMVSTDHIMFQCPIAIFLWVFIRDVLEWGSAPTNSEEVGADLLGYGRQVTRQNLIFICAGALCAL